MMISVDEARDLILTEATPFSIQRSSLEEADAHVLAEEIKSPLSMPPFDRSAMDGYALFPGKAEEKAFRLIGNSDAGSKELMRVGEGEACRIHTGAPIPEGVDRVVRQEDVERQGDHIRVLEMPGEGANIRKEGEELKKGDPALEKGSYLRPASVSFLASLGVKELELYKKPRVAILYTGDELHAPGSDLPPGGVYESNSFGLAAAMRREGFPIVHRKQVPDDPLKSEVEVGRALAQCDVLLLSGGISVGDRDHVKEALLTQGMEECFHKVRQKPGKPLFFGKGKGKFAFGLPGNPSASLVCLYEYALPFLRACSGIRAPFPKRIRLPILESWEGSSERTVFLKASLEEDGVRPLDAQSSAMLRSFALADALIHVPPGTGRLEKGMMVELDLLG